MADTLVTDKKINWLVKKGYVVAHVKDGVITYSVTDKGKVYLNDASSDKDS